MKRETIPDFFEEYSENKMHDMVNSAWGIADSENNKKYNKTFDKISVENAQKYAAIILDEFNIKDPASKAKYRFEIIAALKNGDREENKTPAGYESIKPAPPIPDRDLTPEEEIGYISHNKE